MYTCYIQSFKTLASFCSRAGWFESYLVENPQRHIFAWCGSFIAAVFSYILSAIKLLKIGTTKKFAVITLKFEQGVMHPNDADASRQNSIHCGPWSDLSLIWVYIVCTGRSVRKFRNIMVISIRTLCVHDVILLFPHSVLFSFIISSLISVP